MMIGTIKLIPEVPYIPEGIIIQCLLIIVY